MNHELNNAGLEGLKKVFIFERYASTLTQQLTIITCILKCKFAISIGKQWNCLLGGSNLECDAWIFETQSHS